QSPSPAMLDPRFPCYIRCRSWLQSMRAFIWFFIADASTTDIYTLSLHDALPISFIMWLGEQISDRGIGNGMSFIFAGIVVGLPRDRKSTRLNSSHGSISYAVFCLKKKK